MPRQLRIAMCLGLMLSMAGTGVTTAAEPIATTTTVNVASGIPWGTPFTITATVSPTPVPDGGSVMVTITDADDAVVHTASVPVVSGQAQVLLNSQSLGRGTYQATADFSGNGDWQPSSGGGSFDVEGEASAISVSLGAPNSAHQIVPGSTMEIRVNVTGAHSGTVEFYETTSGSDVLIGTAPVLESPYVFGYYTARLTVSDVTEGPHSYRADYLGTSRWAPSTDSRALTVTKAPATLKLYAIPNDLEAPGETTLQWNLSSPASEFPRTGTVEVRNETTGALITTGGPSSSWISVPLDDVGTFTFRATYSGDDHYASSTKAKTVTVTADVPHAHAVDVKYAKFYPVVDGYRDTNKISGVREERISVRILIYNARNGVVRSRSLSRGSGAYAWSWNGKNKNGNLVAAGKYRIVQKLTDAKSNSARIVDYVTVSRKKLHLSTLTMTKKGSNASARGSAGVGKARLLSDGSARLVGVSGGKYGWAAVGYQFRLPSATVYKRLKLAVYGSGNPSTAGPTSLGAQRFDRCRYVAGDDWNDACFTHFKSLSPSTGWTSASLANRHRHRRIVRGSVSSFASAVVWKVRLTVTIGVLR